MRLNKTPDIDLSPQVNDEVAYSTCYMCACRCGIKVHLENGEVRFVEGNRDHPVNQGVLCAKGSAGVIELTINKIEHIATVRLRIVLSGLAIICFLERCLSVDL